MSKRSLTKAYSVQYSQAKSPAPRHEATHTNTALLELSKVNTSVKYRTLSSDDAQLLPESVYHDGNHSNLVGVAKFWAVARKVATGSLTVLGRDVELSPFHRKLTAIIFYIQVRHRSVHACNARCCCSELMSFSPLRSLMRVATFLLSCDVPAAAVVCTITSLRVDVVSFVTGAPV